VILLERRGLGEGVQEGGKRTKKSLAVLTVGARLGGKKGRFKGRTGRERNMTRKKETFHQGDRRQKQSGKGEIILRERGDLKRKVKWADLDIPRERGERGIFGKKGGWRFGWRGRNTPSKI